MTYLVLARKWRPSTFEQVVGQAHVTKTLVNAIESGRVGHAYLFSGPRGVGKTTTARLLAKSLNCPNGKGATACNKCDVCREITTGISLDVIEIDAASNRGIDEIRNLRENVKYAPAGAKCKVYVVDEVHMLTEAAFNALLKTLEEPPPHVKFILATTAPLKVPETILSRCQRFEFVRIPAKEIFTRLKEISSKEGFKVGDEVLMLLSRRANGSLRDAESMLDQVVSAGLEDADESAVAELMGLSGADVFFSIIDAVKTKDARKALEKLGEIFDKGTNLDEFTDGLMEHLRNLLLIKIHPDLASLVEASSGYVKHYQEQATQFTEGDLMRLINLASRASVSVRRSELPRLHLEMAVVEMAYLDSTAQVSELLDRFTQLEASLRESRPAETRTEKREPGKVDKARPSLEEVALHSNTEKTPSPQRGTKRDGTTAGGARTGEARSGEVRSGEAGSGEASRDETGKGNVSEPGSKGAAAIPIPLEESAAGPDASQTEGQRREEPPEAELRNRKGLERTAHGASESASVTVQEPAPEPEVSEESREKWKEVLKRLNVRKKALGFCVSGAHFRGISQGKVLLDFGQDKSFEQDFVGRKVNKKILQEELAGVFRMTLGIRCIEIDSDPQQELEATQEEKVSEKESPSETGGVNKEPNAESSVKTIIEFFDGEIIEE